MKPKTSPGPAGPVLQLPHPGTYTLTYQMTFPPMRTVDAAFFLRCNGAVLERTTRRLQKKSGYSLTMQVNTVCNLPCCAKIQIDAVPAQAIHNATPSSFLLCAKMEGKV